MKPTGKGFVQGNAFLLAAVLLPAIVVGLFLLSSAIPPRLVPPPRYDLVIRASGPFDQTRPRVAVDFNVRDGRVEATIRPLKADAFPQLASIFLFEHATMSVRQIPIDLPDDMAEGDAPRTFVVEALASRKVVAKEKSPDGYELQLRSHRSPGIVGEIFGMNRYDQGVALVNGGRIIPIDLPSPYRYQPPAFAIGWLDEGQR
jgi:hypothetical protein